jgi:hypothetical protein
MVLRDSGVLVAGSAVSYRQLARADGTRALVGIMTGSWTLPTARGRGGFTRMIDASLELTRSRGGAVLLAFVTEANASFRRLTAAGATLFPTRYLSGPAAPAARAPRDFTERQASAADHARFEAERPPGLHFAYATPEEWSGQFLDRGRPPTLVETAAGAALVETHGDFDRIQAIAAGQDDSRETVIAACIARAQPRGKRVFLFESRPARADRWAAAFGLDAAAGFVTALPADEAAMAVLTAGAGLSNIGPWSVDGGDRM